VRRLCICWFWLCILLVADQISVSIRRIPRYSALNILSI
jgi:hypothetical protein